VRMDDSPAPVVQKHVTLEGVETNPGKGDETLTVESRAWVAWKWKSEGVPGG
jgi:hypothetical protein